MNHSRACLLRLGLTLLGLLVALGAKADVIPPGSYEAAERLVKNPKVFDRVDQFCKSLPLGGACEIPDPMFEGGGKGTCTSLINRRIGIIDRVCVPAVPRVEHDLPASPWLASPSACAQAGLPQPGRPDVVVVPGASQTFTCTEPPVVTDAYCRALKAGDACQVKLEQPGRSETTQGRCVAEIEEIGMNGPRDYRRASRRVITCQPLREVTRIWTDVPLLDKLRL